MSKIIKSYMIAISFLLIYSNVYAKEKFKKDDLQKYIGCYELQLGPWLPDIKLDPGELVFITPPPKVELQRQIGKSLLEKGKHLLRPAPGTDAGIHTMSWWELDKIMNEFILVWTTGHSGLTVSLKPTKFGLKGYAETFWDFSRTEQRSEVVAQPIPCQ